MIAVYKDYTYLYISLDNISLYMIAVCNLKNVTSYISPDLKDLSINCIVCAEKF